MKGDLDYFPLSVEYQEKLYAGGRIKGSKWIKREGRPTDEEILVGRLIDRSVRPLFPKEYKMDVQLVLMVISVDMENPPEAVAGIAASAAIAISPIPWHGPVGLIRVGLKEAKFITNPTTLELEESDLDMYVSSTKDAIVMVEAGSNQVSEEIIAKGISYAQKEALGVIDFVAKFAKKAGKTKEVVKEVGEDKGIQKKVKDLSKDAIAGLIAKMSDKEAGYTEFDEAKAAVVDEFEAEEKAQAASYFEKLFKYELRELILSGKRPDGRKVDQIRPLSAEIGVLPRTHGSALFSRGATQALSITTLGAPSFELLIETATGEESKHYIHHYSMPPYSTGETGRIGSPNRREIGHGALAERALLPVIPSQEEFPYTIRVVSEILSSNGSTSMASTCGSTLSLMDAGVPIKTPIAGIAMGLIVEDENKFTVLTDIVGLEDGNGDMDFKVAGSKTGITALQLDVKTLKLTVPVLEKALVQAKKARLEILDVITSAIKEPKSTVSQYAPKIKVTSIPKDKIGELVGPGGKTIKRLIRETGTEIDVDDDGTVTVAGINDEGVASALTQIEAITRDPKAGEIYEGVVKRLQPFGAFIEILPGKDGMVHVSDMSKDYVKDPADVVSIGDKVTVRVKEIDDRGRVNLTMLLDKFDEEEKDRERGRARASRPHGRMGGGRFDRSDRRPQMRDNRDRSRSSGPHFPTSRYLQDSKDKYKR